jgi:cellulase/cellobiase CelA1
LRESVSVRNDGQDTLDWSVTLTINGSLTDNWNSVADGDSGEVTFRGADWNRSLAPGQEASFGYCLSTAS